MTAKRIQEYLKLKNISTYAFENAICSSRGAISKAIKNNNSIGSGVLENILTQYPDINADWLLCGRGEMTKNTNNIGIEASSTSKSTNNSTKMMLGQYRVPLYNLDVATGIVSLFTNSSKTAPIDYISIPNIPKCNGAIHIAGDSMYPLLNSGDIVLYKVLTDIQHGIFWGEMYLISFNIDGDEYVTIKYIQQSEEKEFIKLVSHNPDHQPKDIPTKTIMGLALVKASIRFNSLI